jgi:hypothetical protein
MRALFALWIASEAVKRPLPPWGVAIVLLLITAYMCWRIAS